MFRLCTLLILLLGAVPAWAGASALGTPAQEEEKPALTEAEQLQRFIDRIAGLDGPLFSAEEIEPAACPPDYEPQTRGLFIAADKGFENEKFWLWGPKNDAELFSNALILRGAQPDNLAFLTDRAATHAGLAEAARNLAGAARCGDSIILQFSGFAIDATQIGLPGGTDGPFSGAPNTLNASDNLMLQALAGDAFGRGVADHIVAAAPYAVLNVSAPGHGDVLSAAALSEFVTVLRNRGADVAVILDTASAETFAIETRQAQADPDLFSRIDLGGGLCAAGHEPNSPFCRDEPSWKPTALVRQAGELTVFYGTERGDSGVETRLPKAYSVDGVADRKTYGYFSYQLANALAVSERTTVGALARRISAQEESTFRRQNYRLLASDPDLDLIAEDRPERPVQKGQIIIDTPETTRTARKITKPKITVAGRVLGRGQPISVEVNGQPARLVSETGFEAELPLQAGVNMVKIFASTRENEAITHSFELFYEGDIRAVIGEGKRYAVLIANQDYADDSGIPDLGTPVGDAEALAKILSERYGFAIQATMPDGETLDLFLRDAGQRETGLLFDRLNRVVGERDSVLVFYAGHGEYEERGTAYWLPADALAGAYSTFVDAGDITRALNRLVAKNVLVISDSCYSGMLLRSTTTVETPAQDDRLLALQRLAEKRSRVVMSSGGNEPVLDGGGAGHSVFAAALLRALEEPEESAFSARELFAKIMPRVTSMADQTPDFRTIHGAGHEGGDFVFLAAD